MVPSLLAGGSKIGEQVFGAFRRCIPISLKHLSLPLDSAQKNDNSLISRGGI